MSLWLAALPAVLVAVLCVTAPGMLIAWTLRLRGLSFLAGAVAASIAAIGLATIAAGAIGVRWGVLPLIAVSLAIALLVLPLRMLARDRFVYRNDRPRSRASFIAAIGGVLAAGALIAFQLTGDIGAPDNISQTYDGVFHLNAAAHSLITGNVSPFDFQVSAVGSSSAFYPSLWHATVVLVAQLTGASIPVATNAVALAVAAWVWPVAIVFLTKNFVGERHANPILVGLLATGFTAFPYLLLSWGVLYPNLLSTALLPIALGFLHRSLRHRELGVEAPLVSTWVATIGALGASVLSHPNGVFGFALLSAPLLLATANDVRRSELSRGQKAARLSAIGVAALAMLLLWLRVQTGDNTREYGSSIATATIDGFSNAPMLDPRAWFLTVLVVAGVIFLLAAKRHRWLIGSYVITLGFFVVSSSLSGGLRDVLTGAWYNDAHRLAALLPITAVPLAAVAVCKIYDYVSLGLSRDSQSLSGSRVSQVAATLAVLLIALLVVTGSRGQALVAQSGWIRDLYLSDGLLLSDDERDLLERLPEEVPDDAVVAGDPWTGTGLALAISQREVLFAHLKGNYNDEITDLATDFKDMGANSCPILTDLGVTYILDFGSDRYSIGQDELYADYLGLHDVAQSPVVTEIDREGDAALYRVDCG